MRMSKRILQSIAVFGLTSPLYATNFDHMATEAAQVKSGEKTTNSAKPGTFVNAGKKKINLHKGSINLGDSFAWYAKHIDLQLKGVALVNVVPSVDTPVCEEQSHILGESKAISPKVHKVIISRDTAMAQSRFAKEAKLTNITYASDFKKGGAFGKKTGLLMEGSELLARAVFVIDQGGKVVYMQIVKDVTKLPDMEKAIQVANSYASKAS